MPNEHLRARRHAMPSRSGSGRPMSQSELAQAVNRHIWEESGRRVELDAETISRYERGQITWPGAEYRAGLRAVLGVATDGELGFHPRGRGRTPSDGVDHWLATAAVPAEPWLTMNGSGGSVDDLSRTVLAHASATLPGGGSAMAVQQAVRAAFASYQAGGLESAAAHAADALRSMGRDGRLRPDLLLTALVYQISAIVLSKAGRTDVAWLTADRAVRAAETTDHHVIRLSVLRTAAFTMAAAGHREQALTMLDSAAQEFQDRMSRTPMAASVYGTMLLTGAILAAGHGEDARAMLFLDEATQAAQVTGSDRNDLWTAFGPSNVLIHRANVAAAVGDMDKVLAVGGPLQVTHLPVERQVRLHLDLARASLAVGDREDALATLVRAEAASPSQVRHHPIMKDVVTSLLTSSPRRPGVQLTRLAVIVGATT